MYNQSPLTTPTIGMPNPFTPGIGGTPIGPHGGPRLLGSPNLMNTTLPLGSPALMGTHHYPMMSPLMPTSPNPYSPLMPISPNPYSTPGMMAPTTPLRPLSPFSLASPGYTAHMSPGYGGISPQLATAAMVPPPPWPMRTIHVQPVNPLTLPHLTPSQPPPPGPQVIQLVPAGSTAAPTPVHIVQAPANQVLAMPPPPQPMQMLIQSPAQQVIHQQPAQVQLVQQPLAPQVQVLQQRPLPTQQVIQVPPGQVIQQAPLTQVIQVPASQVQAPPTQYVQAPSQVIQQPSPIQLVQQPNSAQMFQQPFPAQTSFLAHTSSKLSPAQPQLPVVHSIPISTNQQPSVSGWVTQQQVSQSALQNRRVSMPVTSASPVQLQRVQQNLNDQLQLRTVSTPDVQTTLQQTQVQHMDNITHQMSSASLQGQPPPAAHLSMQYSKNAFHQDAVYQDGGYHTQDSEYHNQGMALQSRLAGLQGASSASSCPSSGGSNSHGARVGIHPNGVNESPLLYTTSSGASHGARNQTLQESDSGNEHSVGYENY